jgi:hypothetical protein
MSQSAGVVRLNPTISTVNAGLTPILNTTELIKNHGAPIHGTGTTVDLTTIIGQMRGDFLNWRLVIPYFDVGDQDVTLDLQNLIGGVWDDAKDPPAGYAGGANVLAASTRHDGISWLLYDETNVFITFGATKPSFFNIGNPYLTPIVNPGT